MMNELVTNLGSRVVELEKCKEEPEFTTPDRVMDLMNICGDNEMSFTFEISGDGLVIRARSNDGKYEVGTSDIPQHLLRDRDGVRKYVINTVKSCVNSAQLRRGKMPYGYDLMREVKTDGSEEN